MARTSQLKIDVTPALLASGYVDSSARVRNFLERAFAHGISRTFDAPWARGGVLNATGVRPEEGRPAALHLELETGSVSLGDQIVLIAWLDDDAGRAELHDGNAVFVLHVFERADPVTRDRLSGMRLPAFRAEIAATDERAAWRGMRDEVLDLLVAQEAAGPASLEALRGYLIAHGHTLAVDVDGHDGARSLVDASELLSAWMDARRSRFGRPRRQPDDAANERTRPPVADELTVEEPSGPIYDHSSAEPLLTVLDRARDVFGELGPRESDFVADLLEGIREAAAEPPLLREPR